MSAARQPAVDIAERLSRELGARQVVRRDDPKLDDYARDESGLGPYPPDCAVLCDSREQVEAVLRLCAEYRVPVTPRGAGSGMVGGALPVRGGVVLSVERMRRIVEIDPADLVAVVEPGVIVGDLQAAVEAEGLFYPPDPASLALCSIGGNVATNAGGPRAFKYGVTGHYVLGLEVVLMGGEVLRCGRRTAKGVAGYDLVSGFVGSEGTFGVTTEITLKLVPKPAAVATMLAVFDAIAAAGRAVDDLLRRGFRPRAIELMDRVTIDHVRPRARYAFPRTAAAVVLVELDGEPEGLDAAVVRAGQVCDAAGAVDVVVARDERDRRDLWDARRGASRALRDAHRHKINEDVCVPRGRLPELLARIEALAARCDMPIAAFGHAGDGNLHVNLLCDEDRHRPDVAARIDQAARALFADTLALRGTLSGEHGIGLAKRDYLPMEQSPQLIEWQRKWKAMWDPLDLLNPDKVLPPRRACPE
ncbi:MAG: FAD-binding protein [Deltaproteobacteria bacterium]|nr:MAG: FAD-binding protein [Deltaproteobacteria bacterium]